MKADLDHYRKIPILDFRVNTKKFKEYLEFCKKNDLKSEKKYIMESLINTANDKSLELSNNNRIINDITSLCVYSVIFSDIEIEEYIEISNFSINFQKSILYETICYCSDSLKDQKNYISLKFQFWVLKTINKTLVFNGDHSTLTNTICKEDQEQSLSSLCKVIMTQNDFDNEEEKMKIFLLKVAYELGLYYYLSGNDEKTMTFFKYIMSNMKANHIPQMYFDVNKVKGLVEIIQEDMEVNNTMEIDSNNDKNLGNELSKPIMEQFNSDIVMNRENNNNNDDDISQLINISLDLNQSIIQSDYQRINDQIVKEQSEKLQSSKYIINSINLIDYSTIDENLIKSSNLISLSMKNITILKEAIQFANKLKEAINAKLTKNGLSPLEEKSIQNANKDISFQLILLKLTETLFNGEKKLPKKFLVDLSQTILNNTLTDNLRISGLIHGLILNFTSNFKGLFNYFNDFVDFFQKTASPNKIETVNQIILISRVLHVINLVININNNNGTNEPSSSSASSTGKVIIDKDLHYNLLNIFFFWIGPKGNWTKKTNIIFILIETIKVLDYLLILKLIFLGVLKFVLEKKHLTIQSRNETYDTLYDLNPEIFKIDSLFNQNNTITNRQLFSNTQSNTISISFKEDNTKSYYFDALAIPQYINTLFQLITKVEKKIVQHGNYTEEDIILRKVNILFFKKLEEESQDNIIPEYIKMIKLKYLTFKREYFNLDIMNNVEQCVPMYASFAALKDDTQMKRLVYMLYCNQKYLEAAILCQYITKCSYDLVYQLLKKAVDANLNFSHFQYIWKTVYFEYLANFYYKQKKDDVLNQINLLMKRTSNHQFFKAHPLRKHFKIINFFKFIDNL